MDVYSAETWLAQVHGNKDIYSLKTRLAHGYGNVEIYSTETKVIQGNKENILNYNFLLQQSV